MATKDYLNTLNKQVRKNSLKLTALQEQRIMQVYIKLSEELLKEYNSNGISVFKKKMLQEKIKFYNKQVEEIIKEYSELQAQNVVSAHMEVFQDMFKDYDIDREFLNKFGNIDKECVNYVIKGGLYSGGKGISERLWNIGKIQGENIQDILIKGRLQGLGAVELGKLLQAYTTMNNGAWRNASKKLGSAYGSQITKAGVSYEALRLARTFIAHTAQVSLITASKFNPFIEGLQWHTSNSDRVCELCRSRDGVIYKKDNVPFDHPNGMCYQTAVIPKSGKEIGEEVGRWVRGEENPALDKWAKQMSSYSKTPSNKLITTKIRNPKKVKQYKSYTDRFDLINSATTSAGKKYITKIKSEEYKSLAYYTGSGYTNINDQLRFNNNHGEDKNISLISSALKKFEAPEDLTLYRGAVYESIKSAFSTEDEFMELYEKCLMGEASQQYLNEKLVGNVLVDKGFISTSALKNGAFSKDLTFHINVEKGSTYGAYINELSKFKDKEYEFLLDNNLATEISKVELDKDKRLHIHLKILGYAN